MPRNRHYPTSRELREFKDAMKGKSPAEQEKLLRDNSSLSRTHQRATAQHMTRRSSTSIETNVRRIEQGLIRTGPKP